jgi:hypothetical protein
MRYVKILIQIAQVTAIEIHKVNTQIMESLSVPQLKK